MVFTHMIKSINQMHKSFFIINFYKDDHFEPILHILYFNQSIKPKILIDLREINNKNTLK